MKAMVLEQVPARPLANETSWTPLMPRDLRVPTPGEDQVLIRILACGVCRTELDQAEGRIAPPTLPVIVGHQPIGVVAEAGRGVTACRPGDLVGATWIFSSCGHCRWCVRGEENLCPEFQATGCHADGGYADFMIMPQGFTVRIPAAFSEPASIAPLLCAGVVGYRSLKLAALEDGMVLGLFGFGSANHLVLQTARALFPQSPVFVFSRNANEQALARELGAAWTGSIDDAPPNALDRAIDTTPAWRPVLRALERLSPGGRLVINGIRKEDADKRELLETDFPRHLWLEKEVKSVANVTRRDAEEFLAIAAAKITPVVQTYPLKQANDALTDLKAGRIRGSKVLVTEGVLP